MKIKFYSDPGHGWAAVKRKVLVELDILDKISAYSYQKGTTVYLEEDQDMTTFLTALLAKKGDSATYTTKYTDRRHPIRSYEHFKAE
jgi:hypothetical protein